MRLRLAWLAAALGGGLLVGCESAAVRQSYPPDVLFANRRPVEGKAMKPEALLAHNEPAAPPLPEAALATAPRQRLTGARTNTVAQPPADPGPLAPAAAADNESP
jgi:hypothetical protein